MIELLGNQIKNFDSGANIFSYNVKTPSAYGVIENINKKIKIIEKPLKQNPKAITGIYYFDKQVSNYSLKLKQSKRESEIIDLIKIYLNKNKLTITELGRGRG